MAQENQKQIYNDYILLINKIYSDGKTKTKETVIDTGKKSENREYIFTKKSLMVRFITTNASILNICHFELEMTQKAVNNLSKTLALVDKGYQMIVI